MGTYYGLSSSPIIQPLDWREFTPRSAPLVTLADLNAPYAELSNRATTVKRRSKKAQTLSDSDWEPFKAKIIFLYLERRLKLGQVKRRIEDDHPGFTASLAQYKQILNRWEVSKNVREVEMQHIVKKMQIRKLIERGRDLRFYRRWNFGGSYKRKLVENRKIHRWMKENDIPHDELYYPTLGTDTPPNIDAETESEDGSPFSGSVIFQTPSTTTEGSGEERSPILSYIHQVSSDHGSFLSNDEFNRNSIAGASSNQTLRPPLHIRNHSSSSSMNSCPSSSSLEDQVQSREHNLHMLDLQRQFGATSLEEGKYRVAEEAFKTVVEGLAYCHGPENDATMCAQLELASAKQELGHYKEAEKICREVNNHRTAVLGLLHPDTLASMAQLTMVLADLGRMDDSEIMGKQVAELREQELGPEHRDTLKSKNDLVKLHLMRGRYEEAEELGEQLRATYTRTFGLDDRDALACTSNMAEAYSLQRKSDFAESLTLVMIDDYTRIHGHDHPLVLRSMSNLVVIYIEHEHPQLDKAADLGEALLRAQEGNFGCDHPDTLTTMNNLAYVYMEQGLLKKGEKMSMKALTIYDSGALGQNHPDAVLCLDTYACILERQDRLDEAIGQMARCIRLTDPKHPDRLEFVEKMDEWCRKLEARRAPRRRL
ncbi:TPR-like protein [Microthyrium microscopicum]|uniref:TPR-like protein n=1 Tax=Microthyrium microscopicum TaxID=703497 RepID=A0A6A6TSY6_9PEZI|nr:TPR-like protein [Microthyrium microscopicum]